MTRFRGILPAFVIVTAAAGILLLCVGAKAALTHNLGWPCPIRSLFHIPCPGCGSTRAFAALASFDPVLALRFNPLLILAIPFGACALIFESRLARYSTLGWALFAGAVLCNWLYLFFFLPR